MKIKPTNLLWITLTVLSINCLKSTAQNSKPSETYKNIEFKMAKVQEPIIPKNTVNIIDFGAVNGGYVLNTKAFADAIDAVSKKGGGKVIIPPGIWLTGPIILKSNIELYASTGALIKFSTNKDLYPIIETSFEGLNTWRCISPIYGKNLENVAFTGNGVYDGSGEVWRMVKKSKLTESQWKTLIASGGVLNDKKESWYPSEQYVKGNQNADQNVRPDLKTKEEFQAIRDFLRPVMVSIQNSKRVLFDGPVFQNSPAWNIHPLMVEDLIVRNVTVRNPWYSQNGDGLDVESCKNVVIENSSFDVGDDAICIKSGKDKDGRDRGVPCENIIVKNNIVYHGHGGVTVGSEMSGGVKNLHVSNCTFMGTDVGLRFKSTRGRGGIVENIFISDIYMIDIPSQAISFDLYYGGKSIAETLAEGGNKVSTKMVPVNDETPQFKNISIKNITISGAYQAVFLQGLPEMNLENIEISNLTAKAQKGFSIIDANGIKINNAKLDIENPTVFEIYNGKNMSLKNVEFNSTSTKAITIDGAASEKIELVTDKKSDYSKKTTITETVSKGAVKF
ncbi:glycoside hydrolase family 28 protein [Flavobacterium sp. ANB]|uniref:glycoside hydrolase family 28 protein n=1 Tax=unclassified Flavobacterium TaxID=196869 RepID=UPI0012B6ADA5|nr:MULTISPECIES: glycoside hydrolase family 28 protein [unclassified Flavobacterium]MBF4516015.1 glycoside hydrolase family 28 protein [Flavobacterium sp. ANB]MTD69017.1 glycoside hydrolase family 28 protein [Flavobacterium sp. LC2016-13]